MNMIESVISSLITVLGEQLPAKITSLNNSYGDSVVLDAPSRYLEYEPALQEVPERPLVMVLAGPSRPLADTGYGGGGWADYEHVVGIGILIEDADPGRLAKRLLRSQRAIVEVVGANRTGVLDKDGVSAWAGLSIVSTDPGERFRAGSMDPYMQVTIVTVKATRTEA